MVDSTDLLNKSCMCREQEGPEGYFIRRKTLLERKWGGEKTHPDSLILILENIF